MGLYHIDPCQRPFRALYEGRRLASDRDKVLVEWSFRDRTRTPSVWSVLSWLLLALCFGGSILSSGLSVLAGIVAGGPIVGPWWWVGVGCLVGLFELATIVSLRRRQPAIQPSGRLFAIRRLEQPPAKLFFAPVALSWRLLRRAFRGRHEQRESVHVVPMWWIIAIPLILCAAPDSVAIVVGESVCGEATAYLPILGWCHDAMAFAEAPTWPPVASNVTAAVGVIVVTKAAVWSSVVLSIIGLVAVILRSAEARLTLAGRTARRRFALWLRLNPARPLSLLVLGVSFVALYDTIVRLAFVGAMSVVTTESVTAFVLWAVTGAVFTHLALRGVGSLVVERRVDALIHPWRAQDAP